MKRHILSKMRKFCLNQFFWV